MFCAGINAHGIGYRHLIVTRLTASANMSLCNIFAELGCLTQRTGARFSKDHKIYHMIIIRLL